MCIKQTLQNNAVTKNCSTGQRDNYVISHLESQNLTKGMQMNKCAAEERCVCCVRAKGMRPSFNKQHGKSQMQQSLELIVIFVD